MRVYLDENLSADIAKILRRQGVDAASAYEVGNRHLSDASQLAYATREHRAIVSRDVEHSLRLDREAIRKNADHGGIMLVPSSFTGNEYAAIARAIVRVAREYPRGLASTIVFLRHED